MEIGNIGELAAEPVKGLDDDNVEDAPIKVGKQPLIAGTKARCSAGGRVCVRGDDRPSLFVDISAAQLDLIFDRGATLVLRAVPCVEGNSHLQAHSYRSVGTRDRRRNSRIRC